MEPIVYHHTLPIQIRFNDVDKFGHVNNTVYFSFYDLGKTEYFATVYPHVDWEKNGIVVVHIDVDFLEQIYSTDHIAVQTAVTEIGTKSFRLAQQVIDTRTGVVKCVCNSVMVAFDLESHTSIALDNEWVEAINHFERRELRKEKKEKKHI
ncbi:MAG: acyl-CoA thioesterase [Mediterranea sp.]|jgi:acyl-CoA thioester hydrolase|nr:acyl-CoA thioesterase [Mediterranea sp.]